MTLAQALEALKGAGFAPVHVPSEDPFHTDDDIELGAGAGLQLIQTTRHGIRFWPKFHHGEGDDFAMWDLHRHYADPVEAAKAAVDLRARVLAEIGG